MPFILFSLVVAWTVMLLFGGLEFDNALLLALYAGDKPNLALAARIVTEAGGYRVLIAATAAGAAWLLYRRRIRSALLLLAITLGGRMLVEAQKVWTDRLRPGDQDHLVQVQSLAFPSGHAANATIVWLSLALLLTERGSKRSAALWTAVWLAILVGISRLMLGVHWPSDVIGGWAFGLFWTLALLRLSGRDVSDGTPPLPPPFSARRRSDMTDRNDRGADRAETARQTDDSDLIDSMEGAPSHGNRSGHNIAHDLATRDELKQDVGDPSVTRVRDSDKPEQANLPRFNEGNHKLNP